MCPKKKPTKEPEDNAPELPPMPEALEAAEAPVGLEHPDYKALQQQLTEAEEKVNEHWNQVLRLQAELANMQRRKQEELASAHKYGIEKFVNELLSVVDSHERALEEFEKAELPDAKGLHEGVKLTLNLLLGILQKFGVIQVDPVGHVFDPALHEAVSVIPDPNAEPNTVVQVLQKGYTLNERLVRAAMVIVAEKQQ